MTLQESNFLRVCTSIGVPFKTSSCLGRSVFIRRPNPAAAIIAPTFMGLIVPYRNQADRTTETRKFGVRPRISVSLWFSAKLPTALDAPERERVQAGVRV